ncbi:MAG: sugar phosphate isomerase/epimerase [Kiritimatiellae bacterium]|nr:sugar phosphate isomerase/epimerase [Kiritimatiellia bacterium]
MKEGMRIGAAGLCVSPPKELDGPGQYRWCLEQAAAAGLDAFGGGTDALPDDPGVVRPLGEFARARGIELEVSAFRCVFDLCGPDAKQARDVLAGRIGVARALGTRILRTGYGRLNVRTSRFNLAMPLADHLRHLTRALREAARMVEDRDMLLAVENHCDFTGRQLAEILHGVGSSNVGAALDTGNGFTVFTHPHEDVEHLAPLTITTHIKDMKIVDDDPRRTVCFGVVGCALGDGHVDIPWVLEQLAARSPHARGLHLLIEFGWVPKDPQRSSEEQNAYVFQRSLAYLRRVACAAHIEPVAAVG